MTIVIPPQQTVQQQFAYAQRLDAEYRAPLNRDRRAYLSEESLAGFRKVIELFPNDTMFVNRAWLNIAMIHETERHWSKALRIYKRLSRDAPDDAFVVASSLYGSALIYDRLGKYEKALSHYDRIVAAYGDSKDPVLSGIARNARWRHQQVRAK